MGGGHRTHGPWQRNGNIRPFRAPSYGYGPSGAPALYGLPEANCGGIYGTPPVSAGPSPVLGGPVLGGPVLGGPVLGGPVLGGPVLGGPVLGGPVLGGPVLGGPVLGGPVLGGPVLGGPVLGGPVLGGPVLGGPVLGGPVLGGPVLGGPVLGGPVLGGPVRVPARAGPVWRYTKAAMKGRTMAQEPMEAGMVTTEQAMMLLLTDSAGMKKLEREGAFKQVAPNRYWLKDLVQGFARHAKEHQYETNSETLAGCWGVSSVRVNQLHREGWFKQLESTARGRYNWIEACNGFVRFLRDEDRRSTRSAADSRIKDAKARDIETRTQQRLSRLVPLEVYEEMIDNIAGMVRAEFAGLAAASTRDLTMRRIIEREVNARLRRIAEGAMAQAIRLETNGSS